MSAALPVKRIYVYPFQNDHPVYSFEVDATTNLKVHLGNIKKTFGLTDELHKIGFMFYSADKREKVIPWAQFPNLIQQINDELSLRLYNYLPQERSFGGAQSLEEDPWENDTYFAGYSYMQIHWEMLSDVRRCQAYAKAINDNKIDFKDKIVLDVGCGTGILSIYAAKAGARKVYGVDASDVVHKAELVVQANNCQDVVEIIHGKIEEISLPVEKVDIIVSEWMGYFLIFESMLECVIFARDKWLKKGGLLFPCFASLYMAPINYEKFYRERILFWETPVEGVVLTPLINFAKDEFLSARCLRSTEIRTEDLLCEGQSFKEINLNTVTIQEIRTTKAALIFKVPSDHKEFHGYGTYFDVIFQGSDKTKTVCLSTHPKEPKTHWRQDCWLFKEPLSINKGDEIRVTIDVNQMKWKRHYEISVTTKVGNEEPVKREWAI